MKIYKCDICGKEIKSKDCDSVTIKDAMKLFTGQFFESPIESKYDICVACRAKLISLLNNRKGAVIERETGKPV